jgi:hypothetical protein
MAKVTKTRSYPSDHVDRCYKAAEAALPGAGFKIWKTRPVGWLIMARQEGPEGLIEANLAARPGAGATVTLTLSGESSSEATLSGLAGKIFGELEASLGAAS